jgi:carboxypeptidase C (cathepsin A)
MHKLFALPALMLAAAVSLPALAVDTTKTPGKPEAATTAPLAPDSTTEGVFNASGEHIAYTAVAGTITVGATEAEDEAIGIDGKPLSGSPAALVKNPADAPPTASMFYVAYFKKGADPETRPITFFYNGGPGSSTMWLHMGSFGPMHVSTPGDQHLPAAPYKLEQNPYSLLDVTDLVFIDAPGTGFSRFYGKNPQKAFWGVDEDGHAFARFIARFLGKYNRWNSPKYLFGESYGTTRSAVLVNMLENDKDIDVNGVILLSQIFDFSSDIDSPDANPGIDLPYETALPTFAATAWYHHKLPYQPAELLPFLKEVEAFAMGPYTQALEQGTDLPQAQKQAIAEKLHEYTGLSVDYLMRANLRVSGPEFSKNLQIGNDLTTGRLDTRFSGPSLDPLSREAEYDPQASAISSAYVSAFNNYVRKVLKYGDNMTYLPEANIGVGSPKWDMKHNGNDINTNVAIDLATAMKTNPKLKVMVNGGYFDLATPFYAAWYEDKHLPIPDSLAKNIQYDWYKSGHMVYVNAASLKNLHENVEAFIRGTDTGNM